MRNRVVHLALAAVMLQTISCGLGEFENKRQKSQDSEKVPAESFELAAVESGFRLLASNPAHGSKGVTAQRPTELYFSHDIAKGTSFDSIRLATTDRTYSGMATISGRTLRLSLPEFLSHTTYKAIVPAGAITSLDGRYNNSEITIEFATGEIAEHDLITQAALEPIAPISKSFDAATYAKVLSNHKKFISPNSKGGYSLAEKDVYTEDELVNLIHGHIIFIGWQGIPVGKSTPSDRVLKMASRFISYHPEFFMPGDDGLNHSMVHSSSDGKWLYYPSMAYRPRAEKVKEGLSTAVSLAKKYMAKTQSIKGRAKLAHDYLAGTVRYDYVNYKNGTVPQESYSIYGALIKKVAVCQGYAAAFNAIAYFSEVDSIGVSGVGINSTKDKGDHAWNKVYIDNKISFVDTTWDNGNPAGTPKLLQKYFMISATALKKNHIWDDAQYPLRYFQNVHWDW